MISSSPGCLHTGLKTMFHNNNSNNKSLCFWRDGLVGKVLAMQARGPDYRFPEAMEKLGAVVCVYSLTLVGWG